MAFWGIEVKPGKPFKHAFDTSKGRLHISQATLGLGSTTNKSIVQCNVGNKSPVFLCSLFPEKTESLQLNVEFEEGEEVLFSVIGPRSVHLTGHYVSGGRHFLANDESESYGEDIADTETERSDRSKEDTYEDSFIDDNEPTISQSSLGSEDGAFNKKKSKKAKSKSRRLKKKYQLSESDDDNCLQQDHNVNDKANVVPVVESEDDDFFTISSLRKPKTSLKSTNNEAKDKVDKKASKADYKTEDELILKSTDIEVKDEVDKRAIDTDNTIEEFDDSVKDPRRETCHVVVENEAMRSSTIVVTEVDQEIGYVSKKKKKRQHKKQNNTEATGSNCTNILKEDQVPQDEPSAEKKHRNGHQEAISTQETDKLDNTLSLASEVDPGNVVRSKKKKRQREENMTSNVDANHSSVVEEDDEPIQQGKNEKGEASVNLPLENGAKRKKKRKERAKGAEAERCDNEVEQLGAENEPKKKKKKKKRTKSEDE